MKPCNRCEYYHEGTPCINVPAQCFHDDIGEVIAANIHWRWNGCEKFKPRTWRVWTISRHCDFLLPEFAVNGIPGCADLGCEDGNINLCEEDTCPMKINKEDKT